MSDPGSPKSDPNTRRPNEPPRHGEAQDGPIREDGPRQDAVGEPDGQTELEQLKEQLVQAGDRVLRTQAELENYRKRIRREIEEERRYANLPLMRDLLQVVNNIDRAIEAAENASAPADLLEGFKMVALQLGAVLEQHQCRRIEADGTPFDPNLHEAVSQQPSGEHPENTILHVVQEGYRLHDRVVRPSQVIISAAQPEESQQDADQPPREEPRARQQR